MGMGSVVEAMRRRRPGVCPEAAAAARGAAGRTPIRMGERDSAPLLLPCPECRGAGEVGRQMDVDVWRLWRCDECAGDGLMPALCGQCDRAAVALVEDGEPVCGRCAADYQQGPVPMEAAPWQ